MSYTLHCQHVIALHADNWYPTRPHTHCVVVRCPNTYTCMLTGMPYTRHFHPHTTSHRDRIVSSPPAAMQDFAHPFMVANHEVHATNLSLSNIT